MLTIMHSVVRFQKRENHEGIGIKIKLKVRSKLDQIWFNLKSIILWFTL